MKSKRIVIFLLVISMFCTLSLTVFAGALGSRPFTVSQSNSQWKNRNSDCWDVPTAGNRTFALTVTRGSYVSVFLKQWMGLWDPEIASWKNITSINQVFNLEADDHYAEIYWKTGGESAGTVSIT